MGTCQTHTRFSLPHCFISSLNQGFEKQQTRFTHDNPEFTVSGFSDFFTQFFAVYSFSQMTVSQDDTLKSLFDEARLRHIKALKVILIKKQREINTFFFENIY